MEMGRKMVVVVVLVMVLEGSTKAFEFCNKNENDLMACKPAVTQPHPVKPTLECCKALSGADLKCLCSYRNSIMLPALGIDPDLARQLLVKCKLTLPTNC